MTQSCIVLDSSINNTMTIETSISYQVVENSTYYLHLLHHRLVPKKRFEGHCHRSKLHFWY